MNQKFESRANCTPLSPEEYMVFREIKPICFIISETFAMPLAFITVGILT
jgi:hypothetical protein